MNILNFVNTFIQNNFAGILSGAISLLGVWKVAGFFWDKFKPIEKMGEFIESWAFNKGRQFALFYKSRVSSDEFRAKTLKELIDESEKIQDAFVRGIESV